MGARIATTCAPPVWTVRESAPASPRNPSDGHQYHLGCQERTDASSWVEPLNTGVPTICPLERWVESMASPASRVVTRCKNTDESKARVYSSMKPEWNTTASATSES